MSVVEFLPVRYSREGAGSGVAAITIIVALASIVGIPIIVAIYGRNPDVQGMAKKFLPRIRRAEEPGKPTH